MDLVQDNQDVLMCIEKCAIRIWKSNKTITDGDMFTVYEKLSGLFERRKKNLPDVPAFVTENQKQLYVELKELCSGLIHDSDADLERLMELTGGMMIDVSVSNHLMSQLLKRLTQSVKHFSGGKTRSDYFTNVSQYLP